MLQAIVTQVLEGPDIADVKNLLNILLDGNKLRFDAQVLEGTVIADIGSPLNILLVQHCQRFCMRDCRLVLPELLALA